MMGIYLLNISADTADPRPDYIPEDLTFNDQESIIEIVVEQFLGFKDAFKEYDDHDSEDHGQKTNVKINLIQLSAGHITVTVPCTGVDKKRFSDDYIYLADGFYQIDAPPPKV